MDIFLFYIILILFLAVTVFLGYRGTKELNDFTLACRSVHPYMMAISYGASFISTSAIVGFGVVGAVCGLGILWLPFLNIFFAHAIGCIHVHSFFQKPVCPGLCPKKKWAQGPTFSKLGIGISIATSVILGFYSPPNIIVRSTSLFFMGQGFAAGLPVYPY